MSQAHWKTVLMHSGLKKKKRKKVTVMILQLFSRGLSKCTVNERICLNCWGRFTLEHFVRRDSTWQEDVLIEVSTAWSPLLPPVACTQRHPHGSHGTTESAFFIWMSRTLLVCLSEASDRGHLACDPPTCVCPEVYGTVDLTVAYSVRWHQFILKKKHWHWRMWWNYLFNIMEIPHRWAAAYKSVAKLTFSSPSTYCL